MYIKVKIFPDSKKEEIKKHKDNYIIFVKEQAKQNMANKRVCQIMASLLGISVKNIRIISGHQTSNKILSITLPKNLV